MRSVWTLPSAVPAPAGPGWRDAALIGAFALAAVAEALLRPGLPAVVPSLIVLLLLLPGLLWRRTHPFVVFVTTALVTQVETIALGHSPQLVSGAYVLIYLYALFRWASGRAMVLGGALVVAGLAVQLLRGSVQDTVGGSAVVVAAATLAFAVRSRAAGRLREIERGRMLERERLARDLHDTVAHHVSAIAIQAQAGLATMAARPESASEALRVIETEASRTLAEMRSMVRVLRQDDARLADLHTLARAEDPTVEVALGTLADLDVPPAVGAAAFRIAQEAVTNARRHARGVTRIRVVVDADSHELRLRITDDGEPQAPSAPGYGITGMTERAALLGGTVSVMPGSVTAALPLGRAVRGRR